MITAKDCARHLAQRAEEVCRHLLPAGKKIGHEWCVGNVDGDPGRSLKVCLSADKAGVWCDFAGEQSGDLLDLWVIVKRCVDLSTAIKEASLYLGLGSPQFEPRRSFDAFKKPEQKKLAVPDVQAPVFKYLTEERKLLPETISAFQVSEDGRTMVFPYVRDNEILQIKYISLDREPNGKKKAWTVKDALPCLFGWQTIPSDARSITLAEGEIDAMSLYQYGVPALSVPFGAGKGAKHKWLEFEFDRLAMFDEMFLCFDDDPAGQEAVADLVTRLGRHRCRIVKLPCKDPNECLQAGISREQVAQCFAVASTLDPSELKQASILVDKVIDEFYPPEGSLTGYNPPWEKALGKILFRPAELSIWTGINGHGKSQLIGQAMLSMMQQGARICVASLELKPQKLLMRLTRQAAGVDRPTNDYIRAIHQWYNDKLWIFDLVGTAKADRLLEVFLYARQKYGIDVFVIDSFLKLDIAEDDYKTQKAFIEKLCDFKNEHDCQVHLIVHPRKSADETLSPGKLDMKGTGAVSDLADNCFSVWRNKAKEAAKHKQANGNSLNQNDQQALKIADCYWSCDKNRNGDHEGRFGLWFHQRSFQYLNHESQKPVQYVPYSTTQGS
ncbi:MAG: toprim domain-containing protein [Gammaproteobacteria bacterium]